MKFKVLAALLGMSVIIYFLPIPVTQTRTITIKGSYHKILDETGNLANWKNWWPDSSGSFNIGDTIFVAGSQRFVLQRKDPLALIISEKGKSIFHYITVQPNNDSSTSVSWNQVRYIKTALAQYIRSITGKHLNTQRALGFLKRHIEDTAGYYGYNISVQPVDDTFILVVKKPCLKREIPGCLKSMFAQLETKLTVESYSGKAERMFYIDSTSSDTAKVMAGLSVSKRFKVNMPYEMMQMPRAHIVVGEFTGAYNQVNDVHEAILRYMRDHGIAPVAVPYEKVYKVPVNRADSLNMRVKVYHPSMIP